MKDLRRNYEKGELIEGQVPSNPFHLFEEWFDDASKAEGILEPNAMVLSTTTEEGTPDSRIVLLKDLRENEFVFYTNYQSHKGLQLAAIAHCTLLFPWINLERQVIIRGTAQKITEQESTQYFNSRPKSSRIGAWASSQSTPIASRKDLEDQLSSFEKKFAQVDPPKPPHWGGYAVIPNEIEFWQGRPNRLHDRLLYSKTQNSWQLTRLQP